MADPKTKWIIFYEDLTSFSNEDGKPWEAPREGVVCLSIAHRDTGRFLVGYADYYCWHFRDDQWVPHDEMGFHQYLRKPGQNKVVLFGYMVAKDRYLAILEMARNDERLPKQTAEGGINVPVEARFRLDT